MRSILLLLPALLVVCGACTPATDAGLSSFPAAGSGCTSAAELCDGRDNDCDGETDEIGDLAAGGVVGVACGTAVGLCITGVAACRQGALLCDGEGGPQPESCDGQDNDCDGETDERADLASAGVAGIGCGTAVGRCEQGIQECAAGALICDGATVPRPETCDGTDEDCDGEIDEESAGLCDACEAAGELGACRYGVLLCVDGTSVCAPYPSQAEAVDCDLLDNDCDGAFDEAGEAPPPLDGPLAVRAAACGPPVEHREGLPSPEQECEVGVVGCLPVHACLPADCMAACRAGPLDSLATCLSECEDAPSAASLGFRCTAGPGGPSCEALDCEDGFRLDRGRCVPDVEICNNGLDDDGDGLIDGTLGADDECAATVDARGAAHQFGWCDDAEEPECDDRERVGGEFGEEKCFGDNCPFLVELSYAYDLDREEVSVRAYRQCVESGCCEPPHGRLWRMTSQAFPEGAEPPRRPDAPPRCMPPPVVAPPGQAPDSPGLPPGVMGDDDPLLLDLPVSSVSWCQARAYCAWAGKRLPTEYEWERAAMGLGGRRRHGWGDEMPAACPELDCCRAPEFRVEGAPPQGCDPNLPEIPICESDLPERTRPRCLATFGAGASCADRDLDDVCPGCLQATAPVWANEDGATPLGIKNLNGNVSEWVYGWHEWGNDFGGADPRFDPAGDACQPGNVRWKSVRGSSFADGRHLLPSIDRRRAQSIIRTPTHGFRCARTLTDDGDLCDPQLPATPEQCRRAEAGAQASCAAPAFSEPNELELGACEDGVPNHEAACPDSRDDFCPTEDAPACPAYLFRRPVFDGTALLDFVPRGLLSALGVDEAELSAGRFEGQIDSMLRVTLAPLGGDALGIFEIPDEVGQVDGDVIGQGGPGHVAADGRLVFAGVRDGEACVPAAVTTQVFQSERGSLDVRSTCGWSPFDVHAPEAARTLRLSTMFVEGERTEAGIEASLLAVVSEADGELWTFNSPPEVNNALEDTIAPKLSLCELFDVSGCREKPPGCPEGHLAPCPAGDPRCNGYIFPFRLSLVPAQGQPIPRMTVPCEPR